MKKLLFIVSFIFSFSLFAQSADEREIYSLIINSFTEKDIQINNKLFRVSYEDGLGEKEEYDIFMKRFLFLKKSTYKDFIKNNKEIRTINNDFNSDKNITIIDSNNNERIVFQVLASMSVKLRHWCNTRKVKSL